MDFLILGPDGNYVPLVKQLEGQGGGPIHLLVHNRGNWPKDRKLQVFVAVYEPKRPGSIAPARLLTTWLSPDVLDASAGEDNAGKVDHELPLPPGHYVYQIFLCDPSEPVGTPEQAQWWKEEYMPPLEKFPGMVYKAQLNTAVVH